MNEAAFRELEAIYRELEVDLRRLSPVCRQSSKCCRFASAGHQLWTTPIEYEYLRARTGFRGADRTLLEQGTCPFLRDGTCGVRDDRMLGCRIYFCDPAYAPHMAALYEKYHARVKEAMRRHGLPYAYFNYLERVTGDLRQS